MNDDTLQQQLQTVLDREAIKEIRAQIAQALDFRDWPLFEGCFLEEVEADFSSLGLPAGTVRREELRASYQQNLSRAGLRTQHLFTNFRIAITGDMARCVSNFAGHHYLPGAEGGDEYILRGEYTDQLVRTDAGWKIRALAFTPMYQSGNPALLAG